MGGLSGPNTRTPGLDRMAVCVRPGVALQPCPRNERCDHRGAWGGHWQTEAGEGGGEGEGGPLAVQAPHGRGPATAFGLKALLDRAQPPDPAHCERAGDTGVPLVWEGWGGGGRTPGHTAWLRPGEGGDPH